MREEAVEYFCPYCKLWIDDGIHRHHHHNDLVLPDSKRDWRIRVGGEVYNDLEEYEGQTRKIEEIAASLAEADLDEYTKEFTDVLREHIDKIFPQRNLQYREAPWVDEDVALKWAHTELAIRRAYRALLDKKNVLPSKD